ncbi:hypothetical protein VTI74DRAFT_1287 [Chaetomium olivicolor]
MCSSGIAACGACRRCRMAMGKGTLAFTGAGRKGRFTNGFAARNLSSFGDSGHLLNQWPIRTDGVWCLLSRVWDWRFALRKPKDPSPATRRPSDRHVLSTPARPARLPHPTSPPPTRYLALAVTTKPLGELGPGRDRAWTQWGSTDLISADIVAATADSMAGEKQASRQDHGDNLRHGTAMPESAVQSPCVDQRVGLES